MSTVSSAERTLINDLIEFRNETSTYLRGILHGVELAAAIYETPNKNIQAVRTALLNANQILLDLRIMEIVGTPSIAYKINGTSYECSITTDNIASAKNLIYALTEIDNAFSENISIIRSNCTAPSLWSMKVKLHTIINNFVKAK